MHIAIASLKSTSPYSQGRNIDKLEHPEKPKESKDAYELRTWRERCHVSTERNITATSTRKLTLAGTSSSGSTHLASTWGSWLRTRRTRLAERSRR